MVVDNYSILIIIIKYRITPKWIFHLHKKIQREKRNILFLVTWDFYSIHHSVIQFDDVAYNSLHLIGRDILSLPAKRIPRSVTEIKVSKFVHHQYVTYKRIKVQIVQIDAKHVLTLISKVLLNFNSKVHLAQIVMNFHLLEKLGLPFWKHQSTLSYQLPVYWHSRQILAGHRLLQFYPPVLQAHLPDWKKNQLWQFSISFKILTVMYMGQNIKSRIVYVAFCMSSLIVFIKVPT